MIAAYENQILEFAVTNPDIWKKSETIYVSSILHQRYILPMMIALDEKRRLCHRRTYGPRDSDIAWKERLVDRMGTQAETDVLGTDFIADKQALSCLILERGYHCKRAFKLGGKYGGYNFR